MDKKTCNIRELRSQKNLSRAELSRQAKISIRTLESWENGNSLPRDVYLLQKVAKVLMCSIEALLLQQ